MYSFPLHWLVPLALALVMPMAFAQSSSQPATSAAKNAASAPSALRYPSTLSYRSVFADYRAYSEQPVVSWVAANDTVGKIGGWRTYAREAGLADDSPALGPGHKGHQP